MTLNYTIFHLKDLIKHCLVSKQIITFKLTTSPQDVIGLITTLSKIRVSILGILFTKTLSKIQNEGVKRAEVAAWFKNYDEAEKLYLDADMRMLAVRMRKRLGDWFKVVQLLKTGTGGNDAEIEEAYNEVNFFRVIYNYVDSKGGGV